MSPILPGEIQLSEEQLSAYRQIEGSLVGGRLVFVTGRAGTGKSTLLRHLRANLQLKGVTLAPTGIAALNAGGQTIHSFFNFPLGPMDPETAEIPVFRGGQPKSRLINSLQMVFLDEVSMVRADLMDAIHLSLMRNRKSGYAFGGVPIVAFGDIWQLEPVVGGPAEQEFLAHHFNSPFFFDSRVVKDVGIDVIELKTVHRQANDPDFLYILDQIRSGDPQEVHLINERVGEPAEGATLTLTVTNARANLINNRHLMELPYPERHYPAKVEGNFGRELPADENLRLKPGARVMFVKNGKEWVNGSLGTVVGTDEFSAQVQLDEGGAVVEVNPEVWEKSRYGWDRLRNQIVTEPIGSFTQLPLKLAWAVTIHKSQGLTFDRIHIDLDRPAFSHGQVYVALSRCRTLAGLSLTRPVNERDLIVNPHALDFAQRAGLLS
ncbi:MAG: AAA family ATPase [Armatimonadetes bacterium]|nr:AAA family ATPase [Armatimonadota bacterium]MBS1710244.1 AAA family ATPase [Armatimonadota bacterium]MBX3109119.1 AAA family ATPase [Fimbriimonadaceae bacterium]